MPHPLPLQQSLEDAVVVEGIGLHSGAPARLFLRPADPDTGIRFRRTDLPGRPEISAAVDNVTRTTLATTLGHEGVEVHTVEHLISALVGLGIDNVVVELEGPEVPIFDGSAGPFVRLIRDVGTVLQPVEKHVWIPQGPVRVEEGDKWIVIEPAETYSIDFTLIYDDVPAIGTQRLQYEHSPEAYETEIASARTFGLLRDVETMRRNGFALGGDAGNAVVVDHDRVLNEDGLRFPDEFVRHKILDLIGDFGLIGGQLLGRVRACKSGHTLNRRLVKELMRRGLAERSPLSQVPQRLRAWGARDLQVISA